MPLWPGFPFPGGLLLGILLLTNLLAAHLVRFKLAWRRSGILLIHGGLIVLMVSQAVYHYCGVEGTMVKLVVQRGASAPAELTIRRRAIVLGGGQATIR